MSKKVDEPNEMGEFWRAMRAVLKEQRQERAAENMEKLEEVANRLELKVHRITDYQFRIMKPGFTALDYYPVSGKFNIVGTKKYTRQGPDKYLTQMYQPNGE